jgi:hypothetical protein
MASFEMLPSIKYQYTPGRAESGGFMNPFFNSDSPGSLLCCLQPLTNKVAAIVIKKIILFIFISILLFSLHEEFILQH